MKVVLAHGVFDLLHPGHVEHLTQARAFGDRLIVSVVPDRFVRKRIPFCKQDVRVSMLLALRCVDEALLCGGPGPEDLLQRLRPDVYARGSEYVLRDKPEYALLEALGIQATFTKPISLHTSDLIARIRK